MRFAALSALVAFALASCATERLAPVPETGAFSLRLVNIDGDRYLSIRKDGSTHIVQLIDARHPDRATWTRDDWEWYTDRLFPGDEVSFAGLRMLRGSNLVPVGLDSPVAEAPAACATTEETDLAKFQRQVVTSEPAPDLHHTVHLSTECILHAGLSPSQRQAVHVRPNPERFPTRYETVVDLDDDGRAEQRYIRLRNVRKADVILLVEEETGLTRNQQRQLRDAIDRM